MNKISKIVLSLIVIVLLVAIVYSFKQSSTNFHTYTGRTAEANFSIKYPSNWVYYEYSCNIDGVAFWPKEIAPEFTASTNICSANSFLNTAPIVLETSKLELDLVNEEYRSVYDAMKASIKSGI